MSPKGHISITKSNVWWIKYVLVCSCINSCLLSQHFNQCRFDPNVYMLIVSKPLFLMVIYVDDLLIIGSLASTIFIVKTTLCDRFLMKVMALLQLLLGLEINQNYSKDRNFSIQVCERSFSSLSHDQLQANNYTFPIGGTTSGWKGYNIGWLHHVHTTCGETPLSHSLSSWSLICSSYNFHTHEIITWVELERCEAHNQICLGNHQLWDSFWSKMQFGSHSLYNSGWVGDNTDCKFTLGYVLKLGSNPISWSRKSEYIGVINISIYGI